MMAGQWYPGEQYEINRGEEVFAKRIGVAVSRPMGAEADDQVCLIVVYNGDDGEEKSVYVRFTPQEAVEFVQGVTLAVREIELQQ